MDKHDDETVERVRAAIAEGLYYGLPQVDAALVPDDLAASLARAALSALPARAYLVEAGDLGEPLKITPVSARDDALEGLRPIFRRNQWEDLVAAPTYRDGLPETEGNIDGWMVCELLDGEPHVQDPFSVGLSRDGADVTAAAVNYVRTKLAAPARGEG